MSEAEQVRHYTSADIPKALQRQVELSEMVLATIKEPEDRTRLAAQLGQEKIKLAALAGRADWSADEGSKAVDRPVSDARARLVVAAPDASEGRIMADADQAALRAFEAAGVDPETALHRVRYEGPVDRATAAQWRAVEVQESTKARGGGEADAVMAVERAHEAAFAAYDHAAKRLRASAPADVAQKAEQAEEVTKRSRGRKR